MNELEEARWENWKHDAFGKYFALSFKEVWRADRKIHHHYRHESAKLSNRQNANSTNRDLITSLPLRQERIADVLGHKRNSRISRLQGVVNLRLLTIGLPRDFGLSEAVVNTLEAVDEVVGNVLLQHGLDVVTALATEVWTANVDGVLTAVRQVLEIACGGVVGDLGLWSWCRQGTDCQEGSGGDSGETHVGLVGWGLRSLGCGCGCV